MNYVIGSARSAEDGSSYGAAGDQKQSTTPDYRGEVSLQNLYIPARGYWDAWFPKRTTLGSALALAMTQACNNANIGYSQAQGSSGRASVINALHDPNVNTLAKIASPVNSDCSSLVTACLMQAGVLPRLTHTTAYTTYSLPAVLDSMTTHFAKTTVRSADDLIPTGSILLCRDSILKHVVIVTTGLNSVVDPSNPRQYSVDMPHKFSTAFNSTFTTAVKCNFRAGANTNKVIICTLPAGATVKCYGYYDTDRSGKVWYYCRYGKLVGFLSSAVLKR